MRPARSLLPLLLAAALSASPLAPLRAQEDREAVEAELEEVRAEIAEIQSRIDESLGNRDRLLEGLADAERAVGRARRAQAETDQALSEVRGEIVTLESRQDELEAQVGERAGELAVQLVTAYRQGSQSRLKMLLNQDDPRRLSRRLAYHGYLSRARLSAIEELRETVAALERTRRELADEAERLGELLAERKRETQRLESAMGQREEALAALDRRLASDREQLADLERDAAELTRLLEQLADVLADVPADVEIPPFAELAGELDMPVSGRVLEAFGDHRSGELLWTGWLIDVDTGEEVRSVAHGRVAYADWLRGYGLLLIIDHGDEYMSLYAHNEALMRDVGDWVAPGDVVALAGRSGGVDNPALYFELRKGGRPVDPAAWIQR
ncbi:murein hydrolase activator EnvC family protein [Wenzhouxiangella sediminis]|uniref:Peptidase M23 n=1 Tax=Wenzhouxiangella sediminis TaxID=1792836 RepID=A0A3E1K9N4_9GAMM|nr:peptidoglycan DD-metalloendopeptidase family protein [Wenzhouxiangella sediminis]RFF30943.1 peptidase M23 [Wenzhouxiangella sediminis]